MSLLAPVCVAVQNSWMTARHPDGKNSPEAQRARRLVEAFEFESSADFARAIEVDPRRWNNFERGYPFSLDIARRLVTRFSGLTFDWLFDGNPRGLSVDVARRLGEYPLAPGAAAKPQKQPARELPAPRRRRRARS
jgi:hypothetical protein